MKTAEAFPRTTQALAVAQIKKLGGVGILIPEDLPDFDTQRGKVWTLMADGQWHSAGEILSRSGGTEGLRRMRELRSLPGVEIERRRFENTGRSFYYKLTISPAAPYSGEKAHQLRLV